MKRLMLTVFAAGAMAIGMQAAGSPLDTPTDQGTQETSAVTIDAAVTRVDPWTLYESSGAALYQQLCASCHGVDAGGGGPAAGFLSVPAPPLDRLRKDGVAPEHWTYVLREPCEAGHHWGPDGDATMPCWRRIFREALRSDAAPMLVSQKLTNYLEMIQE